MNMRSLGIAGLVIGLLFKILHWPGANIVLLASALLTTASLVHLLIRKRGPWHIEIRRPGMLIASLMSVFVGSFLKAMHWPGANLLLLVGLTACAVWVLIDPSKRAAA